VWLCAAVALWSLRGSSYGWHCKSDTQKVLHLFRSVSPHHPAVVEHLSCNSHVHIINVMKFCQPYAVASAAAGQACASSGTHDSMRALQRQLCKANIWMLQPLQALPCFSYCLAAPHAAATHIAPQHPTLAAVSCQQRCSPPELPPTLSFPCPALCVAAATRFYHNLEHIMSVFDFICFAVKAGVVLQDPAAVDWAVWFHDAVYDPKRCEQSTALFHWVLLSGLTVLLAVFCLKCGLMQNGSASHTLQHAASTGSVQHIHTVRAMQRMLETTSTPYLSCDHAAWLPSCCCISSPCCPAVTQTKLTQHS
jgi:hypothetical protein